MDRLDDEAKTILIGMQREMSEALDLFVRQEVEKTLAIVRPPLKPADPKATKKDVKDTSKQEAEFDAGNNDF